MIRFHSQCVVDNLVDQTKVVTNLLHLQRIGISIDSYIDLNSFSVGTLFLCQIGILYDV